MPRLSGQLRDLTNAEVLGWNLNELEYQTSERQGPVEVWFRGVLVASYPFYAHWVMEQSGLHFGDLHIFDPIARRQIGEHARGSWEEVGHGLHAAVILGTPEE